MSAALDLGIIECAIKPWIPKLNTKKSKLEITISVKLLSDPFIKKSKRPIAMAITMTILNILLDMILGFKGVKV
jgi:hypothetical protein